MAIILMRADGGPSIGAGHLMRLITVAEELRGRGHRLILASHECPPLIAEQFQRLGVEIETIAETPGSEADSDAVQALAAGLSAQAILLDGYVFDAAYQLRLRAAGLPIALIDDLAEEPFYAADLLINQNAGSSREHYAGKGGMKLLLGPRYALIRKEFRETGPARAAAATDPLRLLVTMGGADPVNATTAVIEALSDLPGDFAIDVVIGASNPYGDIIAAVAESSPHEIALTYAAGDMARHMARADCAVTAGGISLLEAAYMKLPCLSLIIADNQAPSVLALAGQGVVQALDVRGGVNRLELKKALSAFLGDRVGQAHMAAMAGRLVDGGGVMRIAEELEKLLATE